MQSLSEPDPYFLLPIISAFLTFLTISMNPNNHNKMTPPLVRNILKYLRYMPFISIPIVSFFPSGLCLYWAVNACFQLILIMIPRLRFVQYFFKDK